MTGRDALAARVRAFVDSGLAGDPTEAFSEVALAVHRWQHRHAPVIAALAPEPASTWQEIPAVPVSLFRDAVVGTVAPGEPHHAFHTSGTTGTGHGVHRMRTTELYDHGAVEWALRSVPSLARLPVVALLEDPRRAVHSSLSHMVGAIAARTGLACTWHVTDGRVDLRTLAARLAGERDPVFVASTAIALVPWLRASPAPLPDGSVVMVTGGFKGRDLEVDDAELTAWARRVLGAELVTEYGMTELSSQLWGEPGRPYRPPPWLRVVAVDAMGRPVHGEPGQLRFYDLCNLDSSVGIETLDHGLVHPDGTVTLHGRLPSAPDRGCSLPVET